MVMVNVFTFEKKNTNSCTKPFLWIQIALWV